LAPLQIKKERPNLEKQSRNKLLIPSSIFFALLVSPIIFAIPALLNGRTLLPPGDVGGLFDAHILIGSILSNGQFPQWNPYAQAGLPLIALAYAGALNPLNLIFAFFSPIAAANILTVITNQLAMSGCYLLARRIDLSRPAAIIASGLYALAALNLLPAVYIGSSATVMAAAWTPWIMLALENLYQRTEWRWVALGAGFLALQFFAGDIQLSFYTFLLGVAFIVYSRVCRKGGARFLMRSAAMLLCGALLSMTQLLPIRELFLFSGANRLDKDPLPFDQVFSGVYPVAIIIVVLTIISILVVSHARRITPSFWLWVSVSLISLSLGQLPTGLHEMLLGWIPVYWLFPSPAVHLYSSALATAILCGFAFNDFSKINLKLGAESDPSTLAIASAGGLIVLASILSIVMVASKGITATQIASHLAAPEYVKFMISRENGMKDFRAINLIRPEDNADNSTPGSGQNPLPFSPANELRVINSPEQISLPWVSEIAGDLRRDGAIGDPNLLMSYHQGLDLLNVKYLVSDDKPGIFEKTFGPLVVDGIKFYRDKLGITLRRGNKINIATEPRTPVSEIALISNMSFSELVEEDSVVCAIRLHTKNDSVLIREIRAGKDTAEWSYDTPEILRVIKHKKARVVTNGQANCIGGCEYITTLKFDRAEIGAIEFEYINPRARLSIHHITLLDPETATAFPIDPRKLIIDRWRKVGQFDNVSVYENRAATSRAWFVKRVVAVTGAEMPDIIKSGRMPDGTVFDPRETALIDQAELIGHGVKLPEISARDAATVAIDHSDTSRIAMTTRNPNQGFLVLSEPFFRGWDAFVDGKRTPVSRINYILQGIPIGAGEHRVEFKYRSPAARNGLSYALLGVLILIAGGFVDGRSFVRLYSLVRSGASYLIFGNSVAARLRSLYRKPSAGSLLSGLFIFTSGAAAVYYSYLMFRYTSKAITGNDSYGYASLAKYITQLKVAQPIVELSQLGLPPDFTTVFIPITYIGGPQPGTMVPQYPPGHPMLIAAFSLLFGWETGPFLIGPISVIASSALTYLIARELGLSRKLSTVAGIMLALTPIVVYMGLQMISDAPSMALCLGAVYASLACRRKTGFGWVAGMFFGLAVLLRPTNLFLIMPVIFCLPLNIRAITYFMLGGLPSALFLYVYNSSVYGSPFQSSYGFSALDVFQPSFSYMSIRFSYYTYWIARFMSPLILAGWLGAIFNHELSIRVRAFLISWFSSYFIMYCMYSFYNDWWFTRFLLPGWPALIIGSLFTAKYVGAMLAKNVNPHNYVLASRIPPLALITVVIVFSVYHIKSLSLFDTHLGAQNEKNIVLWADKQLPRNALVVSGYLGGLVKYYGSLSMIKYSEVNEARWNILKEKAQSKGVPVYALLTPPEVEPAQKCIPAEWRLLGTYEHQTLWRIATE